MVRRFLGMSAKEWRATPWWEQGVLLDGLEKEGKISRGLPPVPGSPESALKAERVHQDGMTTITERDYEFDLSDNLAMPESGFSVGTLG